MTIRELWITMPRSEKIGGAFLIVAFPLLMTAIAVMMP